PDVSASDITPPSLHDALPIFDAAGATACHAHERAQQRRLAHAVAAEERQGAAFAEGKADAVDDDGLGVAGAQVLDAQEVRQGSPDRKSTRLNSSHDQISYAVF